MTNQELLKAIEKSREDSNSEFREIRDELKDLKKEFYIFKGKAFGFISILAFAINFAFEYVKRK